MSFQIGLDQNTHLMFRTIRFFRTQNFVQNYGDLGENELDERSGTIPQALLRMNGALSKDMIQTGNILNSAYQIAAMSSSDEKCLETCYLVTLARVPSPAERQHFLAQIESAGNSNQRMKVIEDIFWSLFNSPEFSWNH